MSRLPSSGALCSRQQVNWVSETHNGRLMYKLIQVAIGCRDLQIWVTASAELTDSSSHSSRAWHTVISVIDICPESDGILWPGGIMWPRSGVVSSARCNYNADLAVQTLELWRPRPSSYCKISQLLTTDHTMTGFPVAATILYQPHWTRAVERSRSITRSSVMGS